MFNRNIYLLGFMGSGKSYWGQKLANDLGWQFLDLDAKIEAQEGCSIRQIFEARGEEYFRSLESASLRETASIKEPTIIALGGGTPCFGDNMSWILNNGISIFLNPSQSTLLQRLQKETDQRPLLMGMSKERLAQFIAKKLEERTFFYKQANYIIEENDPIISKIKVMIQQKPLLLLHGALGSKDQLKPMEEELKSKGADVRVLNFTGHGGRASNGHPFSIDLFTQDVVNYMAEQELEQVDIFGYSMGGYVALNLAKLYPDKVGKIITLATKFDWSPATAAKEIKMLDPSIIEAKVPAFAQLLAKRHAPQDWKEHLKLTADLMINLGAGAGLSTDDFLSINQEAIISVGRKDKMVSEEETTRIADALPNGRLKVFDDFPHPIEKIDLDLMVKTIAALVEEKEK
ncbi:alpha/beta fold hydrolase [Aureispira anguillae]|uniref:Shikimate kinase n=1 Tax=Aureispira anguillae TaxID=2864201 RepID=A0A915YEG4_9BACT|nr:alpha/beta fold hydrolase [Aureispira anguillae]BDS11627.1 alpha/beta fold hydrolase [Aureispira anguillae]